MAKLIDKLTFLKNTSTQRAAEKAAQDERDRKEAEQSEIKLGVDAAEMMIPKIYEKILALGENDDTEYEIMVQSNSNEKKLTPWEAAFAVTITQYFESEGVTVKQTQKKMDFAFSKSTYSTKITFTW